ncbi:WG repeat-containing protein [Sphingobacterium sp. N143]|uniref:WG repeat-containing protein n=1 Tax=Sphingobacterium sp. N143 TaxID=2746727 RepID=UPI0025773681|nr:WG repeat-containing protein [Sphingobacterium sp. N143]MDM1293317.1 WG repeat-containing protein [Sphingobacterium sp. N143]
MKKTFLSLAVLMAVSSASFGQINKAFKINYSIVFANQETGTEQETPVSLYEAYVNNEKIKVISSTEGQESIFLAEKNADKSMVLYPSLAKYTVKDEEPTSYSINLVPGKTKEIAGYSCQLAQIEIPDMEDMEGNTTLSIWYSDQLPVIYWEGFDIFKKIPGAVLQISTPLGVDIVAQSVLDSELNDNDFIIPQEYEQVESIYAEEQDSADSNQLAENLYLFEDTTTGLVGLEDGTKKIILPAEYSYIAPFVGDLSIVQDSNEKYGAINLSGNSIIPIKYDYLNYDDHSAQFVFGLNEKYGILDKTGKIHIPANYDMISFMNGGHAVFQLKEKYGLLNQSGQVVIPANYSYISENNATHFISIEDDKYNLVDIKTNKAVTPAYDFISLTEEPDLFLASKDGKYGYLNGLGQIAIPLIYSGATAFSDGLASVTLAGSDDVMLINTKGEKIELDAALDATAEEI